MSCLSKKTIAAFLLGTVLGAGSAGGYVHMHPPSTPAPRKGMDLDTLSRQMDPTSGLEKINETDSGKSFDRFFTAFTNEKTKFQGDRVSVYHLIPGACLVGFDGKSTLDDFTGTTTNVTGKIECLLSDLSQQAQAKVVIDATTLDTQNPDRDKEMHQDVLQTRTYPQIIFNLSKATDIDMDNTQSKGTFTLEGTLSLHGREQKLKIPVTLTRKDRLMQVTGKVTFNMTLFDIKPPSVMGLINTEDEVTVWFDIKAKLMGYMHTPENPAQGGSS